MIVWHRKVNSYLKLRDKAWQSCLVPFNNLLVVFPQCITACGLITFLDGGSTGMILTYCFWSMKTWKRYIKRMLFIIPFLGLVSFHLRPGVFNGNRSEWSSIHGVTRRIISINQNQIWNQEHDFPWIVNLSSTYYKLIVSIANFKVKKSLITTFVWQSQRYGQSVVQKVYTRQKRTDLNAAIDARIALVSNCKNPI